MVKMKRREGLWNLVDPLSRFRDPVDLARPRSESQKEDKQYTSLAGAPLFLDVFSIKTHGQDITWFSICF